MNLALKKYLCPPFLIQMAERKFIIRLNGLPVGSHLYEFEVTDSFFESREYSDIKGANIQVEVELVKQNSLITLTFMINGSLNVLCDRCTQPFDVAIASEERMNLRFGDPEEAHDENVFVLPHGENELDISQPLFEFITLAIPQRLVPCENDKAFACDKETLNKLKNIMTDISVSREGDTIRNNLKS